MHPSDATPPTGQAPHPERSARASPTPPRPSMPGWTARHAMTPETPSVEQLQHGLPTVRLDTPAQDALRLLLGTPELYALPVLAADDTPRGLIERHRFIEYFSRRYALEVHGRQPLSRLLERSVAINATPIVVESTTSIDDVARIIIEAGMQHMVSGFIVTRGGRYLGIANGHDLLNEITRRKQDELYYLAHYDALTGIPNRMLLHDRLTMACRDALRADTLVALMFVDLDRFKQINDTLGHRLGDLLLRAVAQRLVDCVRDSDTVARLGGDEFAILLEHLADPAPAEATAERVVAALQHPFHLQGHDLYVTASLGVVLFPRDETYIENLLARADAAMYEAKQSGRNDFRAYRPGRSRPPTDTLTLEAELRQAIATGQLRLHFQPQLAIAGARLVGAESLVRWQHPERGLLLPSDFIRIAEESGLIVDIGAWVIGEACRQFRAWRAAGIAPDCLAVNISAMQFRRSNFIAVLDRAIGENDVPARCIELELTESIAMHPAQDALATLEALKARGFRLSIDDFGTGFSSLGYLQRFPIDRLKIDQSFVRDIGRIAANRSIVQAIVALARSLALEVIAEGVENAEEYDLIAACGCDQVQGYHIARPMDAGVFGAWLRAMPRTARPGTA